MKQVGIKVEMQPGRSYLHECGYTLEEEIAIYDKVLDDVYTNIRWYLDNLEYLNSFRVSWINYRYKVTTPYKYTSKTKSL